MSLVKFNQGEAFGQLPGIFDEFFGSRFFDKVNSTTSFPAVNVKESNDKFEVSLAAPGLRKEDFSISVDNDVLIISSNHSQEKVEENDRFTRREYNFSSFSRSFSLPENVNADGINAKYENGELKLNIPKKVEVKQELKQISVQ